MRTFLIGALLAVGALPLGAQQDSAARRDSLLERERRRIRGEATVATAGSDDVTRARRRTISLALGAVGPGDWFELTNGGGVTMRTDVGVRAGIDVAWPSMSRADLVVVARLAGASPSAKDRELAGSPGAVATVDALGGFDWLLGERVRLRTAAGVTWVRGPSDVEPWASDDELAPAADLSLATTVTRQSRWSIAAGAGFLRYGGPSNRLYLASTGTVLRPWLEVRRAF